MRKPSWLERRRICPKHFIWALFNMEMWMNPPQSHINLTQSRELHGENYFLSFKKCDCITQTQANANCVLVHKNNGETKREYLQWWCCLVRSSFDLDEKAHVQKACTCRGRASGLCTPVIKERVRGRPDSRCQFYSCWDEDLLLLLNQCTS